MGLVDVIGTDAHDTHRRPPVLSAARDRVAALLSDEEASMMVEERPRAILANEALAPRALRAASGRRGALAANGGRLVQWLERWSN
jgi:hypothetical protein